MRKFTLFFILTGMLMMSSVSNAESMMKYIKESAITADVKTKLLADPDIKSMHIKVTTSAKKHVTLSGYVNTDAQKQKADDVAKTIAGDGNVKNDLVVKPAKAAKSTTK